MAQTGFRECSFSSQDGLQLYYRDYGPRNSPHAAVLCLPGLTRNSRDFHDLALRLANKRRVLSLDFRGRGRSDYDRNWRHYEPRAYVDDARHLLAATNTHRAVMIGTSLGGFIAIGLALVIPTAVAAVVLNDVGPQVERAGLGRILDYVRRFPPQPDWASAARELRRSFQNLSIKDDAGWMAFAEATYRPGDNGLLRADWDPNIVKPLLHASGIPADLWAIFRAIARIPALAVRGGASDVLSEATFARMKEEKPDLMQVTLPGVGHAPTLTEPAVAAALDALLAPL